MKKILISLAAIAAFATSASAQWYVGGTAGLSVNATEKGTTFGFNIAPEGGYMFNEKIGVGAMLELSTKGEEGLNTFKFHFVPYFRWTYAQVGKVNFFGDVLVRLGSETITAKQNGTKESVSCFSGGISFAPGILVNAGKNWNIVSRIASVGYSGTAKDGISSGSFCFNIISGPTIGVQYNF